MIMPMPYYRAPAASGGGGSVFTMTAGSGSPFPYTGYWGSGGLYSGIFGRTIGSVSGDTSGDGDAITDVSYSTFNGLLAVVVLNGNQSLTNINIDGTDYVLDFDTTSSGFDFYEVVSSPTIVDGASYSIEVS